MKEPKNFKLSGECHDKEVSVQLDHSDANIDECAEAFITVMKGLGWSEATIREYFCELGEE